MEQMIYGCGRLWRVATRAEVRCTGPMTALGQAGQRHVVGVRPACRRTLQGILVSPRDDSWNRSLDTLAERYKTRFLLWQPPR
jgi:hypothetical protein